MSSLEHGLSAHDPKLQTALLYELEPIVEQNLERHIRMAKAWQPHDYIPWSDGRNFDGLMGPSSVARTGFRRTRRWTRSRRPRWS